MFRNKLGRLTREIEDIEGRVLTFKELTKYIGRLQYLQKQLAKYDSTQAEELRLRIGRMLSHLRAWQDIYVS